MRLAVSLLLFTLAGPALGQDQDIHRALIQRDQQSAEFAAQLRGSQDLKQLQNLHAQQLRDAQIPLSADPGVASQLLPYQRGRMAEERVLRLSPPVVRVKPPVPVDLLLSLPGRPRPGVDPVAPEGLGR